MLLRSVFAPDNCCSVSYHTSTPYPHYHIKIILLIAYSLSSLSYVGAVALISKASCELVDVIPFAVMPSNLETLSHWQMPYRGCNVLGFSDLRHMLPLNP